MEAKPWFCSMGSGDAKKGARAAPCSLVHKCQSVPIFGIRGRHAIVGHVARNVVARHDVLHLALVLENVVAIVLTRVLHPLVICSIELVLLIGRKSLLSAH